MLVDEVVELEDVTVVEFVESVVEDVADEVEDGVSLVEVVEDVEVAVPPLELRAKPTPPAIATTTMTTTTVAILPSPPREVFAINRKNGKSVHI